MVKDMTEGKPGRLILEFAIPLLLGNLFQQFYSLVDTANSVSHFFRPRIPNART